MEKLYLYVGIIFAGVFLLKFFMKSSEREQDEHFPYVKKSYILTRAEQEFFLKLQEVVGDKYYIFPQIHLANLLEVKKGEKNWRKYFNKIIQKSVDYTIVDKQTWQTKLVIELDDYTHSRLERTVRDRFVDEAMNNSNINILRVREGMLDDKELKELLG